MTTPQDTEQYIHRAAVDAEGNRIGKITKVYRDEQSGQPVWVLVETGLLGTRKSFAPIHGSRLDGEQPQRQRVIAVGCPADLCLLQRPWAQARTALDGGLVRLTIADGAVLFDAGAAQA